MFVGGGRLPRHRGWRLGLLFVEHLGLVGLGEPHEVVPTEPGFAGGGDELRDGGGRLLFRGRDGRFHIVPRVLRQLVPPVGRVHHQPVESDALDGDEELPIPIGGVLVRGDELPVDRPA